MMLLLIMLQAEAAEPEDVANLATGAVMYYVPTCPHCRETLLEYNKFYEEDVRTYRLDCSAFKEYCSHQNISRFPTIIFYFDGHQYEFNAKFTRDVFATFIARMKVSVFDEEFSRPAISELVHFEYSGSSANEQLFDEIKPHLNHSIELIYSEEQELRAIFNNKILIYKGKYTGRPISLFMLKMSLGPVSNYTVEKSKQFRNQKFAVLIHENDMEELESVRQEWFSQPQDFIYYNLFYKNEQTLWDGKIECANYPCVYVEDYKDYYGGEIQTIDEFFDYVAKVRNGTIAPANAELQSKEENKEENESFGHRLEELPRFQQFLVTLGVTLVIGSVIGYTILKFFTFTEVEKHEKTE